jgi:peptide/nickel transport system permease protein
MKKKGIRVIALAFLGLIGLLAVAIDRLSPYDPVRVDYEAALQPPSLKHPFGTDSFGRDLFTRAFYGARISLFGSALSLFASMVLGLALGGMAGLFRGRLLDVLFSFFILTIWSIPFIVAVLALTAAFGRGAFATFSALAVVNAVLIGRFVRGEVIALRERDFIRAARALGAGNGRILIKHILPNILPPVLVTTVLSFSIFIATEAGISFLGLGTQPPTPSWGSMIREGLPYIGTAWWISFFPGLLLTLCVVSAGFLAESLGTGKE